MIVGVAPQSNAERANPECIDGFIKTLGILIRALVYQGTFVLFKLCL
jgi:hypothetical protein